MIIFTMVNFFDWLDEELDQRNWVRSDLAKRAKISESGLSMAYSGKRGIGPAMLKAIAEALNLPEEIVFRAAGLLEPQADKDPWVEEMSHNLGKLTGLRREIAESLVKSLIAAEESETKSAAAPKATQPR